MPSGTAPLITRPPVEIFGRYPGYGFAGLDVSTAIGNFTQTTFDLRFPGSLLGLLDWQRTYNSHSGAVGALGPGWTTSFSASLVVTPAQGGLLHHTAASVTFHDEDGRILTFTPDGAGRFTSPEDLLASLTQNADGSFALTYTSGQVWSFSSTGQLTGRSMEGQQVTLDYDSQGLLLSVAHSFGRSLTFSYNANRRLTSVAADDGRTVAFAYSAGTVTDSLLQTVTVPGGGVFRFESSGSGQASQVSQITDPDGDLIVANSYDPQTTRVTSQRFASDATVTFSYDDTSGVTTVSYAPAGAEATFQADANGRLVKVTGPDQSTATFSFNTSGYLTSATTPGGTQLTQTHDANGNLLSADFGGATSSWAYDGENRLTSATNPVGDQTSYTYTGSSHMPTGITDAAGGHTTRTVVNGLVTASTNAAGSTTLFGYDSSGNLTSVTDAADQVTTFSHDAAGHRTQRVLPSGATSSWTFNAEGQVTGYTDATGGQSTFQYSAAGRLVAQTDQAGGTTEFGYDPAGNQTTITDPLNETFNYGYDANGNLTSISDPSSAVTRFGYDVFGRLTSVTDAVEVATTFAYDSDGNCTSQHDPSGTWTTQYDARGNPVSVTDPTNATTRYAYDLADRLTGITDVEGGSWQIGYTAVGLPAVVTDAAGGTARATWTADGRLASVIDQLGRKTSIARDSLGRVTEVTDAGGGSTRFSYDPDGRQMSLTTPAGLRVLRELDAVGRVIATVDQRGWITRAEYGPRGELIAQTCASGVTTRSRYDAAGRLTATVDGDGNETLFGYDAAGRLISFTNALGAVTRYGYDPAGHEISDTDPLGRTTKRGYDAAGNVVTLTEPDGQVQHFSYDALSRLISRTAADGTEVSYAYDKLGRRTSMTDGTGITRYSYDAVGNLLTITEPDGAVFTAEYDKAGQRTSLTYPGGLQVSYRYNTKGQLVGLHDSRAGDAAYAVDPDGRLITEELPGRMERRYHYEHGLLHRFIVVRDGVPVADTELRYDPDGRVISQRDDGQHHEYRYDRLGQLVGERRWETQSQPPGGPAPEHWRERDALELTYDVVGNRTSLRRGGRHIHYRYDDASQLVAADIDGQRTEYRYDNSGRLTDRVAGDEHEVIGYDGFGRPVQVTKTRGPLRYRQTATFDGDGLTVMLVLANEDVAREEERGASVRYRWSRDQIPEILAQRAEPELDDARRDEPGRLTADFSYGYGRVFASPEHGAEPFHHDVFGSAVRTERTADWAQATAYQVFGAPEPDTGAPGPDHRPGHRPGPRERRSNAARDHELPGPELPRFGYLGELALGPMIDLRARSYDADLGRFTTPDPLDSRSAGPGNTANPYAYAGNDPVDRSDPLGLLAVPPPGAYIRPLQAAPPTVMPAAGRRANAQSTIQLTADLVASGSGGDFTSLHILAVSTALGAFAIQLAAPWDDFHEEVSVLNAGKGKFLNGRVDLAYVIAPPAPLLPGAPPSPLSRLAAQLWEVKADTTNGGPPAADTQAAVETAAYVKAWNTKPPAQFPGTIAGPGAGLLADAPIPGINVGGWQWYVYSLTPLVPRGAVLYGPKKPPARSPIWWWFWAFSLLGIKGKRVAKQGQGQGQGQPQPQPVYQFTPPLFELSPTPGVVPANGAFWPFLPPLYTAVYGLEPLRA
jgi:RHS repeat-associated protein